MAAYKRYPVFMPNSIAAGTIRIPASAGAENVANGNIPPSSMTTRANAVKTPPNAIRRLSVEREGLISAAPSAAAAHVHAHPCGADITARATDSLRSIRRLIAIGIARHGAIGLIAQVPKCGFVFGIARCQTACRFKIAQSLSNPSFIIICAAYQEVPFCVICSVRNGVQLSQCLFYSATVD